MEELEAVDWYQQRAGATQDSELRAILEHNRDEETEHAMMVLEWIRRNNPVFEENVKTYLSKTGPITKLEAAAESGGVADGAKPDAGAKRGSSGNGSTSRNDGSLGIGSLKGA